MATVSPLAAKNSGDPSEHSDVERLLSLLDPAHRPGSGIDGLTRPRGDEYGFERLVQATPVEHAACLAVLKSQLDSRRLTRRSAGRCVDALIRAIGLARRAGVNAFACDFDEALRLLELARNGGSTKDGPLSAATCSNIRSNIVVLHRAAGREDPFASKGSKARERVNNLLASWQRQDRSALGGRPGAEGVAGAELTQPIGYSTATPINMGHIARLNARAGAKLDRLLLREQARALLIGETHSNVARLALLRTNDVCLGSKPCAWIEVRPDGTGGRDRHPISLPLARILRVLIEDICEGQHGPPWRDELVFQRLGGGCCLKWQRVTRETASEWALRRMLDAAAAQARARREKDIGDPVAVQQCIAAATYESIRDGLIVDCHVANIPVVSLCLFLRKRSPNEILAIYAREDDRTGRGRHGQPW